MVRSACVASPLALLRVRALSTDTLVGTEIPTPAPVTVSDESAVDTRFVGVPAIALLIVRRRLPRLS